MSTKGERKCHKPNRKWGVSRGERSIYHFLMGNKCLSTIINSYIYNIMCLINRKTLHSLYRSFMWTAAFRSESEICRQVSFCLRLVTSFSRYEPRNNETQTAWRNARRGRIAHNGVFKYRSTPTPLGPCLFFSVELPPTI